MTCIRLRGLRSWRWYIEGIAKDSTKNMVVFEKLIAYLNRNKSYIPCYAVRKELGLCNSSAIGEKMNDLVVSESQKHNGMVKIRSFISFTGIVIFL